MKWYPGWSRTLQVLGWLAVTGASPAAAQAIHGAISDSSTGRPLEGAVIQLVGTSRRAVSRAAGEYRFDGLAAGSYVVRAQMIGYAPMVRRVELASGEDAMADFPLVLKPVQLEDMVVVGYGEQNRENLSTAVSSVTAEDVEGKAVASVDAALQGRAPGVYVNQNSGNPGNAITVRVRGAASLSANSQPLYVVDGVPMLSEDYSQTDLGGQGVRAATGLSADEIASLDVLKDAASAAIYGSRGSNGVVLITTKRGTVGKPVVTFNATAGIQSPSKTLDLMNATQYIRYFNEAAKNDGYGIQYFGKLGEADSINTDWQDQIFRSAPIGSAELAVAGGTDAVTYRVSGGYFQQRGIVIGSDYRRLNGRINLDFKASERLHFITSLGLSGERNDRLESDNTVDGAVGNAIANQPYLPVRFNGQFTSPDDGLTYTNSVALAKYNEAFARSNTVLGKVETRWMASDALSLTGRVGFDLYNLRETQYDSPLVIGQYAASVGGVARRAYYQANKYVLDGFLTYGRSWGRHALQVTGGTSLEMNRGESSFIRGETLSDPSLHEVSNATTITSFSGTPTENNLFSAFTRANYTLSDKYLFGATIRTDGSSVFGPENRYGVFPGVSAAWVVSREPFLSGLSTLDFLKLRASYGYTGNVAGSDYPFQSSNCTTNYGTEPGYASCSLGNPALSWEKTRQIDLGADVELFDSRVILAGDWYHKKTSDLIVSRPIAGSSGYTSVYSNVGEIVNKGVELSLTSVNAQPSRAEGFRWTTTLNVAFNRNRVTKLYGDQPFSTGIRSINRVEVGQPIGAFHAYKFKGVDPATGDAIYADLDGDGSLTSADRTVVGSPWPDWSGGFTSSITWKGFDLSTFFQFSHGNEVFNGMKIFSLSGGYYYDNEFTDALKRWQKPGDKTNEPRASFDGTSGAREISSRFVEDGSYLRLQEVTLGYQLPGVVAASMGFDNVRLYVRGHNVFTATGYSGYSPDVNSNGSLANISLGTDFYAYPQARTFSFGIQAGW